MQKNQIYLFSDVGICSIIKPQLNFNASLEKYAYWNKLFKQNHAVQRGSEVGKANGLTVLLDAETFDYTYHLRAGEGKFTIERLKIISLLLKIYSNLYSLIWFDHHDFVGFKLSVHHHLDQPIMSIKEIDISVGSESQVAVATTLTTTTPQAQYRFDPIQRGCYFEGELFLKFLPKEFYR